MKKGTSSRTKKKAAPKRKAAPKKKAAPVKKTAAKPAKASTAATSSAAKSKKTKVKFLKSPTGVFKMAYSKGDVAAIASAQATDMIAAGYCEECK